MPDADSWTEQSSLGCSFVPFLSPLISSIYKIKIPFLFRLQNRCLALIRLYELDPHSFNVESDLIESMPNNDSSIIIPSKIDFDEFVGELTLLKSILPGIDETDCHLEEEIHLTKRLLYDNSSPRPPEEIVSDNSNADIESFSPSPIPIKDSDSHMEEIDLLCTPDSILTVVT
nr:hypothetical protein [Tanacetum cinerariifolium]